MAKNFAQGRALVVGIANYPGVRRLPGTVLNDARDVAGLLQSAEYCSYPSGQVEVLLDAAGTSQRIREGLKRLAKDSGPEDTVVFFFSGHGGREETGPDAGTYLIPYDCDPFRLRATAIECSELTSFFKAIRAGRLVVLLDACHSGGAGELKDASLVGSLKAGLNPSDYDKLVTGSGRVIMSSSRADESSLVIRGMNNSLFSHYLLEALRGSAACAGEDVIRVFEVFRYVSDRVPPHGNEQQHPIFKAHEVESNFPIALHRGGIKAISTDAGSSVRPATRPTRLSGRCKLEISRRLVDRWEDLAVFFEIPLHESARFERGHEL